MPPHQVPPTIGRYEIKSLIGAGGMGTLYLARDTNPNTYRLVALKLLNANLDADLRARFRREARSLAALNHSNVVNIYDSGEYQSSPYIVMEYVRGETLAEKIARKAPMSIGLKLKLMTELCAGLAHAHEAGLIHRDIKPANLMVDDHGRLKLLDFGIARGEAGMTRFGQVTEVNLQIGTPGYMSPEQIEGREIDGRSDLFAVGVVLYELISHHEAFSGSTTLQIENKVLRSQPAPLTSLVAGLDPELESIVNKALAKNRAERYADATQFGSALEHVRWRLGLAESAPVVRSTPLPAGNVGRKSHELRAETAYQRARSLYQEHAREAAKRYCIEALAEEPHHAAARALLHAIDPRAWVASEPSPESRPIPPPTAARGGSGSSAAADRTMLSTRARTREVSGDAPTMIMTQAQILASVSHEPTMVATPARRDTPAPDGRTVVGTHARRDTPAPDGRTVVATHAESRWHMPSRWQRYVPVVAVTALVVVTAIMAVLVAWWAFLPNTTGMTLTVTTATGGTISAPGINCGTGGTDCSATLEQGAGVELQVEADKGFRFSGFTGDCAPGGRTVMNRARTCGATFEEDVPATGGNSGVELLTIAPPTGGTVVAEGIKCGSQGQECSTHRPRGSQMTLVAWADKGFTFQGFTGDCSQSGEAQMIAPRTCGAMFIQAGSTSTLGTGGSKPGVGSSTGGVAAAGNPSGGSVAGGGAASSGGGGSVARGAPSDASAGSGGSAGSAGSAGRAGSAGSAGSAPPPPPPAADTDNELVAPPKPPPPPPMADVARKEIDELLERYRRAYEARNFGAVQQVYPAVGSHIGEQFKQIRSLKYSFAGPPKYIQLDAYNGTAVIEIGSTQTSQMPTGKRAPVEWLERMVLQKRGADNQWVINSVSREQVK